MIQGIIKMFATDGSGQLGEYFLRNNYFNTTNYAANNGLGMEQILMGLISQAAQTNDVFITEDATNLLFPDAGASFGSDLIARNIQRGRDHGIPGFCCYYKKYDNGDQDCSHGWNDRYRGISEGNWHLLQTLYEKPSDIDLFTGGLAQDAFDGGLTGKVFQKMKSKTCTDLL
jgi:peroxidase